MVPPPTAFRAYESVVEQLFETRTLKGSKAVAKAYAAWACKNEPAVRALAAFHPRGVVFLDLGVRGSIEKLHLDAVAARAPKPKPTALPDVGPIPDPREAEPARAFKRPRMLLNRSPSSVVPMPKRLYPLRKRAAAALEAAWRGDVRAEPLKVPVDTAAIRRGEAFVGGCMQGAFLAGCLSDVRPDLRPDGWKTAADDLEELFETLQGLAEQMETRPAPGYSVEGAGTYSLVVRALSPLSTLPKIARGENVIRFPRHAQSTPAPIEHVATELSNLLEAARGGFGPRVAAAFAEVLHPNKARLMVVMERATVSLYAATNHADNDHSPPHLQVHLSHVAGLLRDTVFAYSSRRILFLDCSPGNFLLRGPLTNCADVLVTDLDPQLYRRTRQDPSTCLLLNLAMLGAHLKKHCTDQFFTAFRDLPTGQGTLCEFLKTLPRAGLAESLWTESFGRWRTRAAPGDGTLREDMLSVIFHYFVSSVLRDNVCGGNQRKRRILNTRSIPALFFFVGKLGWPRPLVDVLFGFWDERLVQTVRSLELAEQVAKRIEEAPN